jgi:hypothetical protein
MVLNPALPGAEAAPDRWQMHLCAMPFSQCCHVASRAEHRAALATGYWLHWLSACAIYMCYGSMSAVSASSRGHQKMSTDPPVSL